MTSTSSGLELNVRPVYASRRLSQQSLESVETNSINSDQHLNDATQLVAVSKQRQIGVVVSGFLTICVTIGFNQSYGTFQAAYTNPKTSILSSADSPNVALLAFVGTLGSGLTWAGSIFVNPWLARTSNVRHITVLGSLFMGLGLGLASLSHKGLLYGVGASMLYFPILSVAPEYFDSHRGLALGIILSGAGLGAAAFAPLIQGLISSLGARTALRILAAIITVISLPIAWTAPPSRFPGRRATHIDLAIARKPTFILSVAAALMQSAGNLIPLTFLSDYSISIGYSAGFGAALLSINNGVNAMSRVLSGFTGDLLGRQNMLIVTVIGSAVTVIALWLASIKTIDQATWIAFVVIYGIWAGGYNALYPTTVAEVFGISAYASVNGFIYFIRGLGALIGSPLAGLLLGSSKQSREQDGKGMDNYANVVYLDASLLFGASLCVMAVRYFDARDKGKFERRA